MGRRKGLYPQLWKSGPSDVDHRLYIDCQRARAQARYRGEEWAITEDEYIALWRQDDLYKLKGRGIGCLCMSRVDARLPWTIDNVVIVARLKMFKLSGQTRKGEFYAGYGIRPTESSTGSK